MWFLPLFISTEISSRFPACLKMKSWWTCWGNTSQIRGLHKRSVSPMERPGYNGTFLFLKMERAWTPRNPLLRPPIPSSPAAVTTLGAWPSSGPPPLAAKLGAPGPASADKGQAAAGLGSRLLGGAGGWARRGIPPGLWRPRSAGQWEAGEGDSRSSCRPRGFLNCTLGTAPGAVGGVGKMEVRDKIWWPRGTRL